MDHRLDDSGWSLLRNCGHWNLRRGLRMSGDRLAGKVRLREVGKQPCDPKGGHRATEGGGSNDEDCFVPRGRLETRLHQSPPPPGLGLGDGEDVTGGVGLGLGWCLGVGVA